MFGVVSSIVEVAVEVESIVMDEEEAQTDFPDRYSTINSKFDLDQIQGAFLVIIHHDSTINSEFDLDQIQEAFLAIHDPNLHLTDQALLKGEFVVVTITVGIG